VGCHDLAFEDEMKRTNPSLLEGQREPVAADAQFRIGNAAAHTGT